MELVKAEFSKEFYDSLTADQRKEITIISVNQREEIPLITVDEGKLPYSQDSLWIDLKYTATRAYKKLKDRERKLKQIK